MPGDDLSPVPYGRQLVDEDDVAAVARALRSDYLTTGPAVASFEASLCAFAGAGFGVAVNSGTAALHCAMAALDVGPGDEVIVPPMTFAATANCVLYRGAVPVFADVEPGTLCIDPAQVERNITPRTRAVIGVDYAGQPCDWDALRRIADKHGLVLVADACHALGAAYKGRRVGTLADISCFSFHPVKHITTGEGGMAVTDDVELAGRMRAFRSHGVDSDPNARAAQGGWFYAMEELGFNYRIPDILCALGESQLGKLPVWLKRRRELAARYAEALGAMADVEPLALRSGAEHAWHLYVVRVPAAFRKAVFQGLHARGVLANVHYIPVHLHPYYRRELGTAEGLCPVAEAAYAGIVSLPMHAALSNADQDRVLAALGEALAEARNAASGGGA